MSDTLIDYAKLYSATHEGMSSEEKLERIKKLIRKDIPPLVMLACIIMIVRVKGEVMA